MRPRNGCNRADHLAIFDGLPTSKKLELLSEQVGLPRRIHGFINDLKQHYTMEIVYAQCRPSFTHEFALSRLVDRGYRLAVASNSIRASVDVMLSRAALDGYIEFSLCNTDVPRPKPDPAIYDLAIKKLALHPNEVLVVEDNDNGIRAAQASRGSAPIRTVRQSRHDAIGLRRFGIMTVVTAPSILTMRMEPAAVVVSAPSIHGAAIGDRQASADSQKRQPSDT